MPSVVPPVIVDFFKFVHCCNIFVECAVEKNGFKPRMTCCLLARMNLKPCFISGLNTPSLFCRYVCFMNGSLRVSRLLNCF